MSTLREGYEQEWITELHRQGVQVNGETYDEQQQQCKLAKFKPYKMGKSRTGCQALQDAAKAFERAKKKGYVKVDHRGFYVATNKGPAR